MRPKTDFTWRQARELARASKKLSREPWDTRGITGIIHKNGRFQIQEWEESTLPDFTCESNPIVQEFHIRTPVTAKEVYYFSRNIY